MVKLLDNFYCKKLYIFYENQCVRFYQKVKGKEISKSLFPVFINKEII